MKTILNFLFLSAVCGFFIYLLIGVCEGANPMMWHRSTMAFFVAVNVAADLVIAGQLERGASRNRKTY